jgi:RNA polymerase sigma factor (sigma-70 family)
MSTIQKTLLHHLRSLAAKQASGALSDQQLLETFLTQRSEMAFAALVQRHGPMVMSVCRRLLRNHHDAEDAFQAVFLVFVDKAARLRKQESVSSFLHGIAYHVAAKLKRTSVRRAARERTQARPPFDDPCDDLTWRELRSVLDEELTKLPEQHRAALVLCYLEGKTQDEAARLLGWSKSTFRRRLECGRQRLGSQLARRGITLSAALTAPLLIDGAATASVPPLLAATTVRAGLASALGNTVSGIVSDQVVALAESGVGSLLAKKASIALVLLVSLTLGVGGLLAHRAANSPTFAEAPAAPPAQSSPARSASKEAGIEIKGRVLGPDGKPVAGAKVYVSTYTDKDKSDPKVRSETDADGRFRFTANPAEVDRNEMVAAVAPSYGPDWIALKNAESGEMTLRLVKDDVPLEGRILDLEGRPVGATVRVLGVRKMLGEDLTPWLKELQATANDSEAAHAAHLKYARRTSSVRGILGSPKSVKTDANGRFQLRGFGRERIVDLRVEGPSIESSYVTVISRAGAMKEMPSHLKGANFDYVAAPGKSIRGTVRERGSGKPVAGARIASSPAQVAITDKEGRYEISGVGKSEQYLLGIGGASIIFHFKQVGDTPGLQPVTHDIEVERGLLLRIRVTEKGTGKAVTGQVWYSAAAENPNLKKYTTYPQNLFGFDFTEKDGSFRQVVLPGPGFIAFVADQDRFMPSRIERQNIHAASIHVPFYVSHAFVPINPSAGDPKSLECEIALDPGLSVSGVVVGPDDRPLSGARAAGLGSVYPSHGEPELPDNHFTVRALEAGKPRMVVFWHERTGLARAVVVRGGEKAPRTVRLEPRGVVAGQVVDAKGRPLPGIAVIPRLHKKQEAPLAYSVSDVGRSDLVAILGQHEARPDPVLTDAKGRFRIKGFVSGLNYALTFREKDKDLAEKEISIKPGTTVDLGEIKMESPSEKKQR